MSLSAKKGVLILLCILFLGGLIYIDSADEIAEVKIELSFSLKEEIIHAWQGEDAYYLFLPSYAQLEEIELLSYSTEFEVVNPQMVMMSGSSLQGLPMNEKLECKSVSTKEEFTLCIMQSENLSTIFLETDSGTLERIWSDKEVEENGKIQVFDETGNKLYQGGLKSIKGRGNYSFAHYEKKPLAITIKEEVALIGMNAGTDYVLLSNASDPTLIRNELARRMEEALEMEYTNIGRFVDLYMNGEYLGNYYLCETIEISPKRINITDLEEKMNYLYQKSNYDSFEVYESENKRAKKLPYNADDITGGYLVEREFVDRYRLEYASNPSSFITEGKEHFVVKSPLYCSGEQIDYLKKYFDEAEAALLTEDGKHPDMGCDYTQYIDVDSFVKKYLVEEVTKNYDGGVSSCYFYKDSDDIDGRIKAAPAWDFDMSLGNYLDWMEYFSADSKGVSYLSLHAHASSWYDALYQKEEVYTLICSYYKEKVGPYLKKMAEGMIEEYKNTLSASATMNNIRWKIDLDNNEYYIDRDDSFDSLIQFIKERKAFLDEVWIEQITYHIVTFEKDGAILEIRYLRDGDAIGELPVLTEEGYSDWYYADNQKTVNDSDIVTKEMVIICSKEENEAISEGN